MRKQFAHTCPGDKFGELTIVEFAGNISNRKAKWHCLCSCGKSTTVVQGDLRSGRTLSCGHIRSQRIRETRVANAETLAGMRLSNGTHVIERAGFTKRCDGHEVALWLCRCACGNEFKSLATPLRNGQKKWCAVNCTARRTHKSTHPTRKKLVTIAGQTMPIDDAAELAGMTKEAINYRMKTLGLSAEEAVLKPKKQSNPRKN